MHRSTDCLTPKVGILYISLIISLNIIIFQDSSSSDSDLLKNSPLWPPRSRSPPHHVIPARARHIISIDSSLSDSAKSVSSQDADEIARSNIYLTQIPPQSKLLYFLQVKN